MKCPKCHYLSFEPEARCRNCGYDLALSHHDLELRTDDSYQGPAADLRLRPSDADSGRVATLGLIDLDRVVGEAVHEAPAPAELEQQPAPLRMVTPPAPPARPAAPPARPAAPPARPGTAAPPARPGTAAPPARPAGRPRAKRAPSTTAELPLFVRSQPEPEPEPEPDAGAPLVALPTPPRQPLAVRRASEVHRPRAAAFAAERQEARAKSADLGPFERDLLHDFRSLEQRVAGRTRESAQVTQTPGVALVRRRLAAAAIDASVLGGISAAVLGATLRLCELGLGEFATLPLAPLATFLLLVATGYLLMFTVAGGQTMGKMLMRIRVVGTLESAGSVSPRQAVVRALLTVPSVLMLGLGFFPVLAGQGLALHDRVAHTRVIEA